MASNLPVCLCRAPFGEDHAADCPHRPSADDAQKPAPWDSPLLSRVEIARLLRESGKPYWWRERCCDLATQGRNCVCEFNTSCPTHGERHHGTHD